METNYGCTDCGWEGPESELDFDNVESCFGDDSIEICPNCGCMNVKVLSAPATDKE